MNKPLYECLDTLRSTGRRHNGSEVDASINYVDYYYIEALIRLKKMED